jgi:hypothetical protein
LGDFNLHSPEWDLEAERASASARALSNGMAKAGLLLLNDNDKPTWTQPNKTLSIIDLAFVHMDFFKDHPPTLNIDIDNRVADHAALTLCFDDIPETRSIKSALPQGSIAYDRFIEESIDILSDANNVTDASAMIAEEADDKHSIMVQAKPLPGWWTEACSDAKSAFRSSISDVDKKRWYNTMKKAKNVFFANRITTAADEKLIWGLLKWKQPRPPLKYIQLTDQQGAPIRDTTEVFETFHNHFNATPAQTSTTRPRQQEAREARLWHDFTTQDIRDALRTTSNSSAPGPDGIGWSVLKHLALTERGMEGILKMVRHIIHTGNWPQNLKESTTVVYTQAKKERLHSG